MRRGFTLLEVVVALGIASVSLAAIGQSARTIVLGRRASERQQAATLVAEAHLEAIFANTAEKITAQDSSESVPGRSGAILVHTIVEPGPRENLWHLSVTATPPASAPVRFHTLLRRKWILP
jgi:prepilin-type N-terminal cleavage/methylation domain-containing protein